MNVVESLRLTSWLSPRYKEGCIGGLLLTYMVVHDDPSARVLITPFTPMVARFRQRPTGLVQG